MDPINAKYLNRYWLFPRSVRNKYNPYIETISQVYKSVYNWKSEDMSH